MSGRRLKVLLGILSLVLGLSIYVLFRENTHVAKCFSQIEVIIRIRAFLSEYANDLLKYYLPDFLWGFSLCCGLHVINEPGVMGTVVCGVLALFCGIIWELLQYGGCIAGTGDVLDIIMYLLASLASIIINSKERKS